MTVILRHHRPSMFNQVRLLVFVGLVLVVFLAFSSLPAPALAATQVTLQWNPNSGDGSIGYRVFCRQEGTGYNYQNAAYEGSAANCTVNNLSDNTIYYFVVRAFDGNGIESSDSNEVRYSTPPSAPELISPANDAQNVPLSATFETGPFYDPDKGDYHSQTRWQIFRGRDDLCVFNQSSMYFLTDLQVPPLVLSGNTTYYWTADYYDQGGTGTASESGQHEYFTTCAGVSDSDTQQEPICFKAYHNTINACIAVADGSDGALNAAQPIDQTQVTTATKQTVTLPAGLFNYRVFVAQNGGSAELVITFSAAVSYDYYWIIYQLTGYSDFSNNSSFDQQRRTLTLQIRDGGADDMDGVANGIIVGMGGYGRLSSSSSSTNGSGSDSGSASSCFIDLLFHP